jgi:hypothetical protein
MACGLPWRVFCPSIDGCWSPFVPWPWSWNPPEFAEGFPYACGNDALVSRAVVVEVALSFAREVGDYAARVAPAHRDELCVGIAAAPAHVAKGAVQVVCEGLIGAYALGQCAERHFKRLEIVFWRGGCD